MEGALPCIMKKSAIEHASVKMLEVLEQVSKEARHEKNAAPPINKLLYYWTRKPLVVGRAVALACTLENPDQVKDMLGLNKDRRAYKSRPDTGAYERMLGRPPHNIAVLDPFAGAGNLAFPSAELGLDVACSDYNPLAYLIERASLEVPAELGSSLAREFEDAAHKIIERVEKKVGHLYTPGRLAYLWAWCIRCTHCGQRVPLLNQMHVSKNEKVGLKITPTTDKNFTIKIVKNISEADGSAFTQRRGKAQCISCGNAISHDAMTQDIAKNKDKEMVAIQIQDTGGRGRAFVLPTEHDKKQHHKFIQYFARKQDEISKQSPDEQILASHRKRNTLWIYGIKQWNEFFNERQLLVLSALVAEVISFCNKLGNPHIRLYLSFLVARLVYVYSYGTYWDPSVNTPASTLALRQPRVVFNMAEINPFEKVRGSSKQRI